MTNEQKKLLDFIKENGGRVDVRLIYENFNPITLRSLYRNGNGIVGIDGVGTPKRYAFIKGGHDKFCHNTTADLAP